MLYRTGKILVGTLLLAFGLFALVTPFTPGAWLGLVGLELLGLSFLLPRPVRSKWEAFKERMWGKWRGMFRK
jgi:hypothetical protein